MKTYMFPGQGSQAKGMGGDLFDEYKKLADKADKILGYSIKDLCLNNDQNRLSNTKFTQPALYVVNAFSYYKRIDESKRKPDYVLGHSLGEFNALLAADCFDFEAGLKLVKKRSELMSQASGGAMAAILNSSKAEIEEILRENKFDNIDLVNFNTPSQIVISGAKEEIEAAESFFQKGSIMFYPLNTSGAFHSRFMRDSMQQFEVYLKKFKLKKPSIPVISNVTAQPYGKGEERKLLAAQIASPVKWSDSIEYLMGLGDIDFEEVGHGEVLTNLVAAIKIETKSKRTEEAEATKEKGELPEEPETPQEKSNVTASQEVKIKKGASDSAGIVENSKLSTNEETVADWQSEAHRKVELWNESYPVGTRVKSNLIDDKELETRTEAIVLFEHRAAIYMKGYNGYFDLDEVSPL